MKFTTTLLASSAIIGAGTLAFADAHADMAKEMTLVSWGGAYQASQDKAYLQPYLEMHPELSAVWDESSNEAVAKLRAMNEAGNVTWDLVDAVASDSMRLCDEGLAEELDHAPIVLDPEPPPDPRQPLLAAAPAPFHPLRNPRPTHPQAHSAARRRQRQISHF